MRPAVLGRIGTARDASLTNIAGAGPSQTDVRLSLDLDDFSGIQILDEAGRGSEVSSVTFEIYVGAPGQSEMPAEIRLHR